MSMKIQIKETTYREVHLTDMQVYEVTKRRLMQLIFPGEYIEVIDMEYCLMREEENHHGSKYELRPKTIRTSTRSSFG
jgi:hypothetical protein